MTNLSGTVSPMLLLHAIERIAQATGLQRSNAGGRYLKWLQELYSFLFPFRAAQLGSAGAGTIG